MSAKSAQKSKLILRQTGYSVKAVEEILKWYSPNKQGKRTRHGQSTSDFPY